MENYRCATEENVDGVVTKCPTRHELEIEKEMLLSSDTYGTNGKIHVWEDFVWRRDEEHHHQVIPEYPL